MSADVPSDGDHGDHGDHGDRDEPMSSVPSSEGRSRTARRGAGPRGRARAGGRHRDEPPATGSAAVDAEPDPESVARSIALRLLTGAPRSRAQLAEAMARREVPDPVAARVLDRFTEVGLIDDAEYARVLVRSRQADRGLARRALGFELRRKGIAEDIAAEALSTVGADEEEAVGRELVRRRLASTRGLPREVRVRRTVAMLGRKGYPGGLAHRLVREALDEEAGDGYGTGAQWPGDEPSEYVGED